MLQEPAIPYDRFSEVRVEDVKQYKPGDNITIHIRYCDHCKERVGLHYIDECDAEACDDPVECPYSVDWDGAACGYIVCSHCHRPAHERQLNIDDSKIADSIADMIDLNGAVEPYRSQVSPLRADQKEGSA